MSKVTNNANGITGRRKDKDTDNEADNFCVCVECGQAFDMRDLGQVFHHEAPGHEPVDFDA